MASQAFKQLGFAAEEAWQAFQGDIRARLAEIQGGPGMLESLKGFAAAVDWTERWILCLTALEVLLLTTAVVKRDNQAVTATIFLGTAAVMANLERINSIATQHWQSFARQNYFDKHGVFVGAVLGAPLLLIMFVILVFYLLQLAGLLVVMKRKQLKAEFRRRAAANKAD